MGTSSALEIKIGVDSSPVKTNLDKVQADFVSASAKITKALQSIDGFTNLKKQTEETSKAYDEAQQKVAALAKEIKSGAGGAALAKDFERAKTEAGRLKDALSSQTQQLQQTRTAMAAAGVSTSGLAGQQSALRSQLDATRQKYQDLAKVASARDTLNLTPHIEISAEINKAKQAYASLAASGKLSMAELAQAKVALRERIDELTKRTNGWRESLGNVKAGMVEAAVAAAPMVLAIGQAIKFESSMANVKKVVDASPAAFAALRSEIVAMTREIPMSANELAQIAAAGGQLGIASQDIGAFVKVTAKMATAFDMTAQEAGDSIGKIKNVYQMAVGEVEGLGDTINRLGNTSAAREKDIVEVMLRVGGTSRQFGLAKESTAALAAAFLSLGKAPEVAATSINAMLNRMQTATMQSADFQDALGKIGMSAEEMAAQVAANPQKALDTLLSTLSELSGQQRAEVLTGLFGREFQDDVGVLVGSLGTYRDALDQVADRTQYAGSMNKEFLERTKTTEMQIQLMKNAVVEGAVALGTAYLPAIKTILTPLTTTIRLFADAATAAPKFTASLVAIGSGALVFNQVSKLASVARMAIAGIGVQSATTVPAVVTLTSAMRALRAVSAIFAGYQFGEWLTMRNAIKGTAEAQKELDKNTKLVNDRFQEISQSTGVVVTSMKELDQAVKDGRLHYDQLTGEWKAGAKEQQAATKQSATTMRQATGEALEAMKKKYQEYASEVRRLQSEIAGREQSLAAELRALSRSGMSDVSAWRDQKKEAQEYEAAAKKAAAEAKAAFAQGDTLTADSKWKEAVGYADAAKQAYTSLNTEVKSGEQVVVSQQQALKTSMDGVKSSGELAISILKQQEEAAGSAMKALTEKSGFADLTSGMDEAEKKWLENWENMRSTALRELVVVEERIQKIVDKDRTVYINVKTVESRSTGGPIRGYRLGGAIQALASGGGVRNILAGGSLPGWGGGDKVNLLGEAGEYMINKWASLAAGQPALGALNAGRLDVAIAELSKRVKDRIGYRMGGVVGRLPAMSQRLADGGAVAAGGGADFGTLNLTFPGGVSVPVTTTREQARTLVREFTRMQQRASR
jgi:TP901 family phage tail tape measure protein